MSRFRFRVFLNGKMFPRIDTAFLDALPEGKAEAATDNLDDAIVEIIRQGAIVMQAVGLRDKNGKEIFEGDVLHYFGKDSCGSPVDRTLIVEWQRAQFNIGGTWGYSGEDFFDLYECEVIGNVHENPDLLPSKA